MWRAEKWGNSSTVSHFETRPYVTSRSNQYELWVEMKKRPKERKRWAKASPLPPAHAESWASFAAVRGKWITLGTISFCPMLVNSHQHKTAKTEAWGQIENSDATRCKVLRAEQTYGNFYLCQNLRPFNYHYAAAGSMTKLQVAVTLLISYLRWLLYRQASCLGE